MALADRRETARALLIIADAAAVAASLGLGVQFVVGADLRLAAILTMPFSILLARMFGLYERLGRGLGRSTLTDAPRQFQLATLIALLASLLGDRLTGAVDPGSDARFLALLLITLPTARAAARWLPAALALSDAWCRRPRARRARPSDNRGLSAGRTHLVGWVPLGQLSDAGGP